MPADSNDTPFICGVVEGFYGRPWTTIQRKDLFSRMKEFGLNTYMYAPKDDFKHRAYWRELYSVEEGDQLTALITASKENGITFYYALSPGLDIVYSNIKEVNCLKRKLEQVSQFGCEAFALLFDDIEPEISLTDKEVFQSFGHAQVSVTNDVYQSLGAPKFIFCPTEYCGSRAVPNVTNSDYLNTIGAKLLPQIDIMWTGNKVISKNITVQSIQELSEVLKRNPVIWDNIHANDYDQKRLFLGPYSGRPTELNSHLRGVLTNPNCEYEPNFIAIHTLAQWSKCSFDVKNDSPFNADIKVEIENSESGLPETFCENVYHPRRALRIAVRDWLPIFNCNKPGPTKLEPVKKPLASMLPIAIPPEKLNGENVKDSNFTPICKELVNSLVSPPIILNPLEPMDCNASPALSPKHDAVNMIMDDNIKDEAKMEDIKLDETKMEEAKLEDLKVEEKLNEAKMEDSIKIEEAKMEDTNKIDELPKADEPKLIDSIKVFEPDLKYTKDCDSGEEMMTESEDEMTFDDVMLLVDLFYLPFEYGEKGLWLLNEFNWLKINAHLVSIDVIQENEPHSPEVVEWFDKAGEFDKFSKAVERLLTKLSACKNRSLVYDLYPYVSDIRSVICLLNCFVKWMAMGRVPSSGIVLNPTFTWFSQGYKEAFTNGDQEPWIFRGGLTGELQRLLGLETVNDLFGYKPPEVGSSQHNIRPFEKIDEKRISRVYERCKGYLDSFLVISPEYCFVVENDNEVVGFFLAAMDGRKLLETIEEKNFDDEIFYRHPTLMHMVVDERNMDVTICKKLLTCGLAALKANGCHGICTRVCVDDKSTLELYNKLGFNNIISGTGGGDVLLGRII